GSGWGTISSGATGSISGLSGMANLLQQINGAPAGEFRQSSGRVAAPYVADAPVDEQQAKEDHQHAQDLYGQNGFAQHRNANDQRRNRGDEGGGGEIGGANARQDAVHDLE